LLREFATKAVVRVIVMLSTALVLGVGALLAVPQLPTAWLDRVWHPALAPMVTPPPAVAALPVTIATARREDVPIYLSGIGTVQAYNTVNVKTQVDGKIAQILFREGQDVKAGDNLAVIDPRPYQAQLDQQLAARTRDEAMLQGAKLDLARYQDLVRKNFASQQQVDQQIALVGQYQGAVMTDQAQIDYARTQLGFTTITSPIDGRVGIRQVDAGNFVRAGDGTTLVVITQLKPISVVFTLSADAVARSKLDIGQAKVPVAALAQDDTTELDHGVVELVDNQVDPSTGTIKLKASFPNAALKLWPGNFVNGRLEVETRHGGIIVPSVAVRHGPRCDFAWVLRPDQTVISRCVTTGQVFDGRTLIERGLAAGAEVVVDGQYRLDEGSKVDAKRAAAPRAPAG